MFGAIACGLWMTLRLQSHQVGAVELRDNGVDLRACPLRAPAKRLGCNLGDLPQIAGRQGTADGQGCAPHDDIGKMFDEFVANDVVYLGQAVVVRVRQAILLARRAQVAGYPRCLGAIARQQLAEAGLVDA